MKITIVGGGPGGLYFALLTKRARPDWQIEIYEQNQPLDSFGFGVVFSDETLEEFLSRDPKSYERIRDEFSYWDDIGIHYKGNEIRCSGNGFCGLSRKNLLKTLQERCAEEGVMLTFGERVDASQVKTRFADSDIIVAADGINSPIREHYKDFFKPTLEWKANRFVWMGSTRPMDEFNYFFKETEHGVICAHTYEYEEGRSTWIFEMDEACWQGHGFVETNEEDSKAKLEAIYADELEGHPLLLNRSHWRKFPRIFCENWYHENIVILGDAKASAHFSIGSGTKLAMECGIALSDAVVAHAEQNVEAAFEAYDKARRTQCQITQHNADVSLAWFEHMGRSFDMDPMQFAMVVMCRAKAITYDNLQVRDADFIREVDDAFYARLKAEGGGDYADTRPTAMFTPYKVGELELINRVVMSPMGQYSADEAGNLTDWHYAHYMSHALGGVGLMLVETTAPSADARITANCPGLWTDEHEAQWKRVVDFAHQNTDTKVGLQLGHAGRKGSTQRGWEKPFNPLTEGNWPLVSASPLPWIEGVSDTPRELDRAGMDAVIADFVQATERAARVGFDLLELQAAHGFLLASFLSPLTNLRTDECGGSIENRLRFPLEVFTAMRAAWPKERPMSVRISASDWVEGGITEEDTFAIALAFQAAGCDIVDVSSGGTISRQPPLRGRMYNMHLSEAIRNVTKVPTILVGGVTEPGQINTLVHTRRADLVALARTLLWSPYFVRQAQAWYGAHGQRWPEQYLRSRDVAFGEVGKNRAKQVQAQRKLRPGRHMKQNA
ncbi:FAD-dependent monooxygenase [Paradevosia shaoguanensis]|uniref:oxidoreductase n=1 Tax=Paradevosia shaoguanensis TaxID=1335043 RepID=UPI003C748964